MPNKEAINILINTIQPPIIRNDGKSMAHLLALEAIQKAVVALEAEPIKHGHWIVLHGVLAGDDIYGDMGECSNCGLHLRNWEWNFCPCCGAKMDEVEE